MNLVRIDLQGSIDARNRNDELQEPSILRRSRRRINDHLHNDSIGRALLRLMGFLPCCGRFVEELGRRLALDGRLL